MVDTGVQIARIQVKCSSCQEALVPVTVPVSILGPDGAPKSRNFRRLCWRCHRAQGRTRHSKPVVDFQSYSQRIEQGRLQLLRTQIRILSRAEIEQIEDQIEPPRRA